ncbi:hypothetical protein DPEC_G00074980 [Dallia pectoralis]|uniref:Uncharacterized protein n=1 Tax=Dallia pectoralis TaxID=75939 RepID=A0ACC2H3E4_DALPE|nr:hypothetical protein DPEC_G00074980 [Dallia pectoralis]
MLFSLRFHNHKPLLLQTSQHRLYGPTCESLTTRFSFKYRHGRMTMNQHIVSPFSSEGCGRRKSCLSDPVGFDPESDPLCIYLSFTPEKHTVLFELSGPSKGYLSFALFLDKWMVGMSIEK